MMAEISAGEIKAAMELFDIGIRVIDGGIADRAEKLRRRFEFLTAIYALGRYKAGWPEMASTVREFESVYGEDSVYIPYLRDYWLLWASEIGDVKEALSWAARFDVGKAATSKPSPNTSPERLLFISKVYLEAGDFGQAVRFIELSESAGTESSSSLRLRAAIQRIEVSLRQGKIETAGEKIKSIERLSTQSSTPDSDRLAFFRYRAVLNHYLGRETDTREDLLEAVRLSTKINGSWHPTTRILRLGVASLESPSDLRRQAAGLLADIDSVIDAYPEGHRYVTQAKTLRRRLERLDDVGIKPYFSRNSGFLEFI
jgi:hypothetical protein